MTDYLRFLVSPTDRDRIDPASLVVTETPFDPAPATPDDPWPESLHLQFRITDPANGAPPLRMIFPGDVTFVPRPVAAQIIPQPSDVQALALGNFGTFGTWANQGSLRVHAVERRVASDLNRDNKVPGIGAAPTTAWFEPVEIPLNFINAIWNALTRRDIGVTPGPVITGGDPSWAAEAVSRFYRSTYEPQLRAHATDRDLDDVVSNPMPTLVMDPGTGMVELTVTLARKRLSAEMSAFPGSNPLAVPATHPGHPSYDVMPTRLFLQESRAQLLGADAGNPVADAVIGQNTFLTDIKSQLETLGFGNLGAANNTFDLRTHWAVREFQVYAKMPNVATENVAAPAEYALRLGQIANAMIFNGPISGLLDALTRRTLGFWLQPANTYRCPVVVTARTGGPNYQAVAANGENVWTHDLMTVTGPRILVRDVSGYYPLPAADARDIQLSGQRFIVLGFYDSSGAGGPNMEANRHSWQSMALDGLRLTGVSDANMVNQPANSAMWSTYLTVLPTVREESGSRFDVVNAWDNSTISIPLFHYTLNAGELGGFLAYVRHRDPGLFTQAIEFFGLRPEATWPRTNRAQAKHSSPVQTIREPGVRFTNVPANQAERDYFKTWHWYYRFVMANRVFDDWKRIAYDFARRRIQDIRAVAMTNKPAANPAIPPQGAGAAVSIGDVYTSELANALLLRWHVYRPGNMVTGSTPPYQANVDIWDALRFAQDPATNGGVNVDWTLAVTAWTDDHERALIAGIIRQATLPQLQQAFTRIQNFTHMGQALSNTRNSLDFVPPPA